MDDLQIHATSRNDLPSERIAGTILPKILTTADMVAVFLCIVLFVTNAAILSGAGPAAYTYWILGFLTFLVPCAIATGQLGLLFPGEGSIYVWTAKALGPFAGFFAGFCAWFPGVLGLIATGAGAIPFLQFLFPSWLSDPWQQGLVILGIIACSCAIASLRFRLTQSMTNLICLCYGAAILLLAVAGVMAWIRGQVAPVNYAPAQWAPRWGNVTFYGAVILGLLGVEVPLNMGVEVKHPRSITRYLLWGALIVMLAYLISTFGVLSAVPISQQGNLVSIVLGVQLGLGGSVGQLLGDLSAVIYIGFFLFATVVFNYSFARLPFVSGLDRRLPLVVSRVNRFRVPWVALLVQTVMAGVIALVVFILAPLVVKQHAAGDLATIIYDVIQASLAVIWCLSLIFLFVDVILILRRYPGRFAQKQLAPRWVFVSAAIVGSAASLVAIAVTFTNPWTALVSTSTWNIAVASLVIACLAIGVALYLLGERRVTRDHTDAELLAAVSAHDQE